MGKRNGEQAMTTILPVLARADVSLTPVSPLLSLPSVDGIEASEVGMTFPDNLSYDDWFQIVMRLYQIGDAYRWAIGDALNFGVSRYGEMYSQAEDETSIDYWRLSKYKWVARSVPLRIRNQNLSWSHHCAVAPLSHELQESFLRDAVDGGWGVATLRAIIKDHQMEEEHRFNAARLATVENMIATAHPSDPLGKASLMGERDKLREKMGLPPVPAPSSPTDPLTDALTAEDEAERTADPPTRTFDPDDLFDGVIGGGPLAPPPSTIPETHTYRRLCGLILLHFSEEDKEVLLRGIKRRLGIPPLVGEASAPSCCPHCGRPL